MYQAQKQPFEFKGVKSNTTEPHFALTEIQDMGPISVAIFIDMEILRHPTVMFSSP